MDNTGPNAKQVEYWNEVAGPKWVTMQEKTDLQIGPLGLAMLDSAGIAVGERVLDAGCGCGGTTLQIASRVGPGGNVMGADLSAPMLDRARQRVRDAGLENVEFVQADTQTHDFDPEAYDLITSRFGVMFFADPAAAFSNLRSALKPGGRLAFVCWRTLKENEWASLAVAAAAPHVEFPPPPGPEDPGPFSFADEDRVQRILKSAGFSEVALRKDDRPFPLDEGGLDAAVESRFEFGPISRIVEEATQEQREKIRAALYEALAPYYEEGGPDMKSGAWIATARNG